MNIIPDIAEEFDNLMMLCTLNGLSVDDYEKILIRAKARYIKKRDELIALIGTLQNINVEKIESEKP